ncbi:MAG: DUF167 domain-containing protein [Actinomycetota bacterium]
MALPPYVSTSKGATIVDVFVQPRAAKNAIVGIHGSALKLKVTAPPVEGRANRAAEELVAETLGIPRSAVRVTSGETSRHKRLAISGISGEKVARELELVLSSRPHERG